MSDELTTLLQTAVAAVEAASDPRELDDVRVRYLGKSGRFTERLKQLGRLPAEERKAAGQAINQPAYRQPAIYNHSYTIDGRRYQCMTFPATGQTTCR